jgi:1,4-alpha-glucan branching enzyme
MYPFQHDAERKMTDLADRFAEPDETQRRLLNQLARELLLAQSSDWAFQIYQGTTVEYSSRRFRSHIQRFALIAEMLETGTVDEELLTEIESRDNIFAELDFSIYRTNV